MSKNPNKLPTGLQYVYNMPLKGVDYTGWVIETGKDVFQAVTYLDTKGNDVPEPTSSLNEAKEIVKNGKD